MEKVKMETIRSKIKLGLNLTESEKAFYVVYSKYLDLDILKK